MNIEQVLSERIISFACMIADFAHVFRKILYYYLGGPGRALRSLCFGTLLA